MVDPTPERPVPLQSARALCRGCGTPLRGRQKTSCSARCRARMSRHRLNTAQQERDAEIRTLLEAALNKLWGRP